MRYRRRDYARPHHRLRIDYGFVSTVDAEERRQGIRDVGYGIRDTWVDPAEAVPEIAPMTVGEVNTRVVELAELHERDTQDLYALLEDAQDRDSMDGGGGGLCFPRGLGTPDTATAAEYSHSDTTPDKSWHLQPEEDQIPMSMDTTQNNILPIHPSNDRPSSLAKLHQWRWKPQFARG
ncbi:hypothetical protein Tco_1548331 [Tanacetum coccineum]